VKQSAHSKEVENALADFGSGMLSPVVGEDMRGPGQLLYQSYVAGRIRRTSIRRLFLTHLDSHEATSQVLATITASQTF